MAKSPSKLKPQKSRVDSDLDKYARATAAKPAAAKLDPKVIVFGVVFLIVFGLMGAFLVTTNQNTDTGAPAAAGSTQQSPPIQSR